MKMVDVKRPKKKEANSVDRSVGIADEPYPWGLKLNFEEPEINKIKVLDAVKVGDQVKIQAVGKVTTISMESAEKGKRYHNVSVQLTSVAVDKDGGFDESFAEAAKK